MVDHLPDPFLSPTSLQAELGIPAGSIKATVLIETLPAAFEMDEILYELRQHSAGLNCGRWDYIFSFIKTNRNDPAYVMPDRCQPDLIPCPGGRVSILEIQCLVSLKCDAGRTSAQ